MVSVGTGEICTLASIVISLFFIGDISVENSAMLEGIAIYIVIGGVAVQFLVSLYSTFKTLKKLWRKMLKYRATDFIKAGGKAPIEHESSPTWSLG